MTAKLEDFERALETLRENDVPGPYRIAVHPKSPFIAMLVEAGYTVEIVEPSA